MYAVTHQKSRQPTLARKRSATSHAGLEQCPQVQNVLHRHRAQAKLAIGAPNDRYEQEADHVADQMMRMSEPQVQRQASPEEEEEELVQAKPVPGQIPGINSEIANTIKVAPLQLQRN